LYLTDIRGSFPGIKGTVKEADHSLLLVPRLSRHGTISPRTLTLSQMMLNYPFKDNFFYIIPKSIVHTSQKTHYVPNKKIKLLMLLGDTTAVYCKNHTDHINVLCEKNA
jgi:hypothetical protein